MNDVESKRHAKDVESKRHAKDVESKRRSKDVEQGKRRGGLRVVHTLAVVGLGVVGVIVAFWVLSSIVGILWGVVKVAVIVVVVGALLWFLLRRARR